MCHELTDVQLELRPNVALPELTELLLETPFEFAARVTAATSLEVLLYASVNRAMQLAIQKISEVPQSFFAVDRFVGHVVSRLYVAPAHSGVLRVLPQRFL